MFFRLILTLTGLVACARATGEFIVLHSPKNLVFTNNQALDQSYIKDVFTAALGYDAEPRPWDGMYFKKALDWPEAIVAIVVEGVDSLKITDGKQYPLIVGENEYNTYETLAINLQNKNISVLRSSLNKGYNTLKDTALKKLNSPSTYELKLSALSFKQTVDSKFLEEIQLLRAIADKVKSDFENNPKDEVYWFVISGLQGIFQTYGENKRETKEALTLLSDTLSDVSKAFQAHYKNNVLITAFTNNVNHIRRVRSPSPKDDKGEKITDKEINSDAPNKEQEAETTKENLLEPENLAPNYSPDYPVIFNICLWFTIIFFFSLLAICTVIAQMDPGRDSIIYRMTANRMKKDN